MASMGFVIVGAGLAGVKAAETLRAEGFDGPVVLIGDEPVVPYERPPLSKGYLQGTEARDSFIVHPSDWFVEHDIDVRLGVGVTSVDRRAHEVMLADGARVPYDALLLATGSSPRRLDVPGSDVAGVRYLRTLADADLLKADLARARRVALIGGGWIGLEVAASARQAGVEVTLLERGDLPLLRVLGREVAGAFADLHRAHGVDLRCDVTVRGLRSQGGQLSGVELDDGTLVEADLIVAGVGITPNTALAEAAGLVVDNGVQVDEHLRSSDPDIYAAGDVANAYHPILGRHLRMEHVTNARRQGPVAARSMLGQEASASRLPFFYTDQYDLGMEYTGYAPPGSYDQVVIRGDVSALKFVALWVADGKVLAGMHVNDWDATKPIEALILSGRQIAAREAGRLRDPAHGPLRARCCWPIGRWDPAE